MNNLWPVVSKQNPCPVCGKEDWCALGDYQVKCMRVESANPSKDGGWYHPYGDGREKCKPQFTKRLEAPPVQTIDFPELIRQWSLDTKSFQLQAFAVSLGVSAEALQSLRAVWARPHSAWAFPMCDGTGQIVGIRLRGLDGRKWTVSGSRQGVFLPLLQPSRAIHDGVGVITEGPTDCAAAISLGYQAIGRPACNAGGDLIVETIRRLRLRQVIIICDNDEVRIKSQAGLPGAYELNGDWFRKVSPGIEGAVRLKKHLKNVSSVIWVPPMKDLRAFYNNGGTKTIIESDIRNMIWTKG